MLPIPASVNKLSHIRASHIVEVPSRGEAVIALVVDGNSAGQLLLVLTASSEAPRLMPVRREFCAIDHGTDWPGFHGATGRL